MAPQTFGQELLNLLKEKGSDDPAVLEFLDVKKRQPFKLQPIFDPNKPVSNEKLNRKIFHQLNKSSVKYFSIPIPISHFINEFKCFYFWNSQ